MKKFLPVAGGICGVLSGTGMIYGGIMDGELPKFAWFLIALGYFILAASIGYNYHHCKRKTNKDEKQAL